MKRTNLFDENERENRDVFSALDTDSNKFISPLDLYLSLSDLGIDIKVGLYLIMKISSHGLQYLPLSLYTPCRLRRWKSYSAWSMSMGMGR